MVKGRLIVRDLNTRELFFIYCYESHRGDFYFHQPELDAERNLMFKRIIPNVIPNRDISFQSFEKASSTADIIGNLIYQRDTVSWTRKLNSKHNTTFKGEVKYYNSSFKVKVEGLNTEIPLEYGFKIVSNYYRINKILSSDGTVTDLL